MICRPDDNIVLKANNYLQARQSRIRAKPKVMHYLEVLRDEVGFDELKKKVVNPLEGQEDRGILRLSSAPSGQRPCRWTIRRIRRFMEDFIRAIGADTGTVLRCGTNAAADT